MTHTDVSDVGRPIVLIPLGSYEQHGPHLPPDTDTLIAEWLCRAAAERIGNQTDGIRCLVTPPIGIGASGEHSGFTATLSVGSGVLADALVEIARSADWAARLVFVNGHGGNHDAINVARRIIESEKRPVDFWSPRGPGGGDLHAGHVETSVMMAIRPDAVRRERIVRGPDTGATDLVPVLRTRGVRAVSSNGVIGDPSRADAAAGRTILDSWLADLCGVLGSHSGSTRT